MAEHSLLGPLDRFAEEAITILRARYPNVAPRAVRLEVKPYERIEQSATAIDDGVTLCGQPLIVRIPSWDWARMPFKEAVSEVLLPALQDAVHARAQAAHART